MGGREVSPVHPSTGVKQSTNQIINKSLGEEKEGMTRKACVDSRAGNKWVLFGNVLFGGFLHG